MDRKTKFSLSFKEELVKKLLEGKIGSTALSKEYGISDRYLRRLAKRYEDQGSLQHQPKQVIYEKAFKIDCVLSVMKKQLSLSEAATVFGIPTDSTIVKWMKLYGEYGEVGLESKKVGRTKSMSVPKKKNKKESAVPEVSALQQEIEYLRAENAYLKKLSALIQQKKSKLNASKPKPSTN